MIKKVAVIMGSDSDLDTMRPCLGRLKSFGVPFEVHIISAHRTPAAAEAFASLAKERGKGIPVACVAVDGADNAAILAAQMLALADGALAEQLARFKADMAAEVAAKDQSIRTMEEF